MIQNGGISMSRYRSRPPDLWRYAVEQALREQARQERYNRIMNAILRWKIRCRRRVICLKIAWVNRKIRFWQYVHDFVERMMK